MRFRTTPRNLNGPVCSVCDGGDDAHQTPRIARDPRQRWNDGRWSLDVDHHPDGRPSQTSASRGPSHLTRRIQLGLQDERLAVGSTAHQPQGSARKQKKQNGVRVHGQNHVQHEGITLRNVQCRNESACVRRGLSVFTSPVERGGYDARKAAQVGLGGRLALHVVDISMQRCVLVESISDHPLRHGRRPGRLATNLSCGACKASTSKTTRDPPSDGGACVSRSADVGSFIATGLLPMRTSMCTRRPGDHRPVAARAGPLHASVSALYDQPSTLVSIGGNTPDQRGPTQHPGEEGTSPDARHTHRFPDPFWSTSCKERRRDHRTVALEAAEGTPWVDPRLRSRRHVPCRPAAATPTVCSSRRDHRRD